MNQWTEHANNLVASWPALSRPQKDRLAVLLGRQATVSQPRRPAIPIDSRRGKAA